jgi:hypothetical protein
MARIRGPIPIDQFKQPVCRHRTTDALKAIGAFSAELVNANFRSGRSPGEPLAVQHFSLAAAARAALLYGNEHREQPVDRDDVRDMCGYFLQVEDPALEQEPGMDRIRGMLSRIAYEQASFQYSEMENVRRSVAVLLDHAEGCDGALSADEWRELLGVTLEEFMRIGFGMHVAALQNGGQISRSLLEAPHVAPIFTPLPAEQALAVIDTKYAGTVADLRDLGRGTEVPGLEKWSLNPLLVKPIVAVGDGYVLPIPSYVIDRFTPTGLYFIALAKHGSRFTDALGCMFERYVGAQLRHIEATRVGDPSSDDDIEKKIGHAIEQINNSAALLEADPVLAHINPTGLPVRGMVVTLEPFHLINTLVYEDVLTPAKVPTVVVSAHELEGFIAAVLPEPNPDVYLAAAYNPTDELAPRSLSAAVNGLELLASLRRSRVRAAEYLRFRYIRMDATGDVYAMQKTTVHLPSDMKAAVAYEARRQGVSRGRRHTERYRCCPQPSQAAGWLVRECGAPRGASRRAARRLRRTMIVTRAACWRVQPK